MTTLDSHLQEKIAFWQSDFFDQATRDQLNLLLKNNESEQLKEAFSKNLTFGTGGLRGIMGVGTNRMNRYTVSLATQGFSNYLHKIFQDQEIKVAIAFDSRHQSREFAQIAAEVFSANHINVYLFDELRPTPLLSFAIRELGCKAGVVITASHNPKEYNGYKAYWEDGAQLTAPHDFAIMNEINTTNLGQVRFQVNPSLIQPVPAEVEQAYLSHTELLCRFIDPAAPSQLSVVYTPLHGTGITLIPKVLNQIGFPVVHVVEEQALPHGDFPTVLYPNPEEKDALAMALEKARSIGADLVIATDPDADRVGIAVPMAPSDEWILLNGNQTGSLLLYYLLEKLVEQKELSSKYFVVKTVVTTDLISEMATQRGISCFETLTGFKYIASLIREFEHERIFLIGMEESYGYLVRDFVRDKDGIASSALIAQMAAYAKHEFGGLYNLLLKIYEEFGYYHDTLISRTKKGLKGIEEITQMMDMLRQSPPRELLGSPVVSIRDFNILEEKSIEGEHLKHLHGFEPSNLLQFINTDGSKLSIRPSGTEPKIKFYVSQKANFQEGQSLGALQKSLDQQVQLMVETLGI